MIIEIKSLSGSCKVVLEDLVLIFTFRAFRVKCTLTINHVCHAKRLCAAFFYMTDLYPCCHVSYVGRVSALANRNLSIFTLCTL